MDKTLEMVLVVMSIVFVLFTAAVDPKASLLVALVAIVCLVAYRGMFNKKTKKIKTKTTKKVVTKRVVKAKVKSRSKKRK